MPGPWRSKLKEYQSKIAEERNKIPPTPYVEIARILNAEPYKLGITAGSIWAFVKARDPSRKRKVFKLPDEERPPKSQAPQSPHLQTHPSGEDEYEKRSRETENKPRPKLKSFND
jgi:hypothetical protein